MKQVALPKWETNNFRSQVRVPIAGQSRAELLRRRADRGWVQGHTRRAPAAGTVTLFPEQSFS